MKPAIQRCSIFLQFCTCVFLFGPPPRGAFAVETRLQLGGNVNEKLTWLTPAVLDQTHTRWVRGFVPASEFIGGRRSLKTDPGIATIIAAADSGHKIVLSIKWDSAQEGKAGPVPAPDSAQEKACFKFADDLLAATAGKIAILCVENELTIDSIKADQQPGPDGQAPIVRFLKRLVEHLAREKLLDVDGKPLPMYAGGFTRLDQPKMQSAAVVKQAIDWINSDAHVTGCDFHLHQPDLATSRQAMDFIRKAISSKPLIVTEFSLVMLWKQHLTDAIGAGSEGAAFASQLNLSPQMTVAEYCDRAYAQPVPEAQWQAFLKSQPWFDAKYLDEIVPEMQSHGVIVATYALTLPPPGQEPAQSRHITTETVPWFLNQLLVPTIARSDTPDRLPVNYGFFDSYVRYQGK